MAECDLALWLKRQQLAFYDHYKKLNLINMSNSNLSGDHCQINDPHGSINSMMESASGHGRFNLMDKTITLLQLLHDRLHSQ